MAIDFAAISKAFSPRVFNRAIQAFDKATIVIVASSWGGALLIMIFALYTLSLSATAKRETLEAAAMEPTLPKIVTRSPNKQDMEPLVQRLEKRFPDISFRLGTDRTLTISARTGNRFRTWLTVLSYVDTISPWFRWRIKDFCVGGSCSSGTPMIAVLKAEKSPSHYVKSDRKEGGKRKLSSLKISVRLAGPYL